MKNSWSSYVRNTAFRPAGLSRGSSSSEAFWNAPFSLSNSSIFSPVNCWSTRGFVLASSYFIFFPPLPSFYSLLHAFPIDSLIQEGLASRVGRRLQGALKQLAVVLALALHRARFKDDAQRGTARIWG